jgi:hypothetical protein
MVDVDFLPTSPKTLALPRVEGSTVKGFDLDADDFTQSSSRGLPYRGAGDHQVLFSPIGQRPTFEVSVRLQTAHARAHFSCGRDR